MYLFSWIFYWEVSGEWIWPFASWCLALEVPLILKQVRWDCLKSHWGSHSSHGRGRTWAQTWSPKPLCPQLLLPPLSSLFILFHLIQSYWYTFTGLLLYKKALALHSTSAWWQGEGRKWSFCGGWQEEWTKKSFGKSKNFICVNDCRISHEEGSSKRCSKKGKASRSTRYNIVALGAYVNWGSDTLCLTMY